MNTKILNEIIVGLKNIFIFLYFYIFSLFFRKQKNSVVDTIHTISYRKFSSGGGGGGGAVQTIQEQLLGYKYKSKKLIYTYQEENFFSNSGSLSEIWGAIFMVFLKTQKEKNTVYITHDFATAFGLYLLKKKYTFVCHTQGPKLEEKYNFNEHVSFINKLIISYCEKKSFINAFMTCFPSDGAQRYFFESKYCLFSKNKINLGPSLYNTLSFSPPKKNINNLDEDNNIITFYSIGSLTFAKGIDQIPNFLENYLILCRKLRYILVGDGPLRENILNELNRLKLKFENFEFFYFEKCSYGQILNIHSISNVYIMLQRISIFDLSTLEAMKYGNMIILSAVGGNFDFNKNNNILYFDDKIEFNECFNKIQFLKNELGCKNSLTYSDYFDNKQFISGYRNMMELLCV